MNREQRSSLAIGVAVFIAGGVLLGLEIASSRVLAPFFGNSLYVWGSLIGIVLAGLSTGYWLGGIMADRYPTPRLLVGAARRRRAARARDPVRRRLGPGPRRRLGSGPAAEPRDRHHPPLRPAEPRPRQRVAGRGAPEGPLDRGARPHGRAALRHLDGGLDRRHVPDLVLADPRARHRSGAGVGRHCPDPGGRRRGARREARDCVRARPDARRCERRGGRLAGARQGRDGCRLAASELVAGVPAAVSRGPQRRDRGVARAATRSSPPRTRSTTASPSSTTTRSRYLRFDSSFQSGMYLDDPYRTRFSYSDYLQLSFAYRAQTRRILYVGLGGGSAPKRTWRDFPGVRIDVVELDPEVVDMAYKYFELPRDPRLTVEVEDGRRYVSGHEGPWDVIVIDAFYSDAIPFHLATREFLELARSRLTPAGSWSRTSSAPSKARTRVSSARCFAPTARSSRPSRSIPCSTPAATTSSRSATSSSWPVRGPRRRSSSCSTAGARCAAASPGAPDLVDGDQGSRGCTHLDPGRAGADRRLRADRRPVAPLRLVRSGGRRRRESELPFGTACASTCSMNELMARGSKGFVMTAVRPGLERLRLDQRILLRRHEDERQLAGALVGLESRRETEAVEHGHADVEQHDVGHVVEGELEALLSVRGLEHLVAVELQDGRTDEPYRGVVVDDEHARRAGTARRHAGSGFSVTASDPPVNAQQSSSAVSGRRLLPGCLRADQGGAGSCGPAMHVPRSAAAAVTLSAVARNLPIVRSAIFGANAGGGVQASPATRSSDDTNNEHATHSDRERAQGSARANRRASSPGSATR